MSLDEDAQRRIRERRQQRLAGAIALPPRPRADPPPRPPKQKAPARPPRPDPLPKPPKPARPEPVYPPGTWSLHELHPLVAPEMRYATFTTYANRYLSLGGGSGKPVRYTRADAAVLRLFLDSNDTDRIRHVGPTLMAELVDQIRAGEPERAPEVAARSGAFSVVYRPTWLP